MKKHWFFCLFFLFCLNPPASAEKLNLSQPQMVVIMERTTELSPLSSRHLSFSVEPGSWYDCAAQIFLLKIGPEAPQGIVVDGWKTSCNVDPDVELDANLKYADAEEGNFFVNIHANATVIDALDTTAGKSARTNLGFAVPQGKVLYIEFDSDPEDIATQWHVEVSYHIAVEEIK